MTQIQSLFHFEEPSDQAHSPYLAFDCCSAGQKSKVLAQLWVGKCWAGWVSAWNRNLIIIFFYSPPCLTPPCSERSCPSRHPC